MSVILPIKNKSPKIPDTCWLAPNATVVGDVTMGENCTIWFNAVIRGDVNSIKIGDRTNIQDNAVIHCTYERAATSIGSNVSIGHTAIIHGCTLEDNVLVGMGAIVMDDVVVKEGAIIAAGAVVLAKTIVESGAIYAGVPAKKVKMAEGDVKAMIGRTANNYIKYASWFNTEDND